MAEAHGKSAKTLEALFAHPIPTNLHWKDVLTLLRRVGSVEYGRHDELHVDVGGHRVSYRHTQDKEIDKEDVIKLKQFLESAGVTPDHPDVQAHDADTYDEPGLIVVLNHREAHIWHQSAANAPVKENGHKLTPHDPRHIRHHLHHKNEDRLIGQRSPEDVEFYKSLVQAVEHAPKVIVIGDATGESSAMKHFKDFLGLHHKAMLQKVEAFVDADLSSLTEPQIREIATRYWH